MLIGVMAYLVGSIVLQYVLLWANQAFLLHLERPQALFPRNTWIVGGMTTYSLLYLIFLAGLIWALYRFNLFPRNLGGTQATAQRNAAPVAPPSDGNRRSAAARRARRASQVSAATTTSNGNARPATTSTRRAAVPPPPAKIGARRAPVPPSPAATENADEVYERVKALQRSRRRKK
jgi:hypothetical protein